MPHPTNSNVNFCDVCNSSFNSMNDFLKHTLSGSHQKKTRDMIIDLDEAERASRPPPQPGPKEASPTVGETRPTLNQPKPQPVPENMESV